MRKINNQSEIKINNHDTYNCNGTVTITSEDGYYIFKCDKCGREKFVGIEDRIEAIKKWNSFNPPDIIALQQENADLKKRVAKLERALEFAVKSINDDTVYALPITNDVFINQAVQEEK